MHKFSCNNTKILHVNSHVSAKMGAAIFNTFKRANNSEAEGST